MRNENEIVAELIRQFPLLDGKVHSDQPRRVTVDMLPQETFMSVITYLHDHMGMTRGHNVVGTDEGESLGFIYLISGEEHIIVVLHTSAPKSDPRIPSLTEMYPSYVLFERELEDLYGAVVEGLPEGRHYPLPDGWPRGQWPMRKEWNPKNFDTKTMTYQAAEGEKPQQGAVNSAEAPAAETKAPDAAPAAEACADGEKAVNINNRVTVPIGPQHPSLDEPGAFMITLEGEVVKDAVIGIGYNHRGLEKACESRTYIQDLYIIERVCGICSHSHTTAYCMAVEQLAKLTVPPRAEYIRLIIAELERLHSHLLWLGVAGHEIGFDTLFMLSWRDREKVLDLLAVLGGNRINYAINCIGGVRRDIDEAVAQEILRGMDTLEKEIQYFIDIASTESTLSARLSGVGVLSYEDCLYYGATGPVARAAGVTDDIRVTEPYGAYRDIPVRVITDTHADVFGRTVVRLIEMLESIRLIREAIAHMPEGPISVRAPRRIPAGEAVVRVEAPRGEDVHYVRSNGTDIPDRVRVRAPTECNWHGMQHMLKGGYLSDVPITIAAIDPCYSCTDRAISLSDADGSITSPIGDIAAGGAADWKTLRAYGIEFYKARGIDLSRLKL